MDFKPGQTIRFTYEHTHVDRNTGGRFKEVFVLHPRYKGKLHAIDLMRLTPAEKQVITAIMDSESKKETHEIPLVRDILSKMDPVREVRSPMNFYKKFVQGFLRHKDAYRIYFLKKIINPLIIKKQPRLPRSFFGQKRTPFAGRPAPAQPTGPTGPTPIPPGVMKGGIQTTAGTPGERLSMLKAAAERLKNAGLKPSNPKIPGAPPPRPKQQGGAKPATPARPPTAAAPPKPATPAKGPTPADRLAMLKAWKKPSK